MKTFTKILLVVSAIGLLMLSPCQATDASEGWQRCVVAAPDVVYPAVIERTATQGTGRFQLSIDPEDGSVTEVKVLKSTGSKLLNAIYVMNFFQWKFRPGTISSATITRGVEILGWGRAYHTGRY